MLPSRAANNALENADFQLLARWYLGAPVIATGGHLYECPLCGSGTVDPFGDHFVCCPKNNMTSRHNALRDCIHQVCVKAGIPVEREQSCQAGSRDADILLLNWDKGRHNALNVTQVCPTSPSHWPLSLTAVTRFLREAEREKEGVGGARCSARGWGFVAAAFSTWGMAGPGARYVLGEIIKHATNGMGGWAAMSIRQSISLTMARSVALQLRARNRVLESLD